MAAFAVFDSEVSKRVFSAVGTATRVFAMHEQVGLGGGGLGDAFFHVVESPYEDFDDDFSRLRACEITLDRTRSTAAWRVDGRKLYEAHTFIPERAQIGFGIWTMLPDRDGRSRSLDGQGLRARWHRFRLSGVATNGTVGCWARATSTKPCGRRWRHPSRTYTRGTKSWTCGFSEPSTRDPDARLPERGSSTFVLVRERGNWLIALAQTTPIAA